MADDTKIAWCDQTFNAWMGCTKISAGCDHCYAESLTTNRMGLEVWGKDATRQVTSESYWRKPIQWNADAESKGKRSRVFCGSLMDWAEKHPIAEATRPKLWALIKATPWLEWLLLTKRPGRIVRCLPDDWGEGWPNVWLGTSIENMDVAYRADQLCKVPAAIRFISYEPALGPLDLSPWFGYNPIHEADNEYRGQCLSCGYQWRTRNRFTGDDLADCPATRRQGQEGHDHDSVPAGPRGARTSERISANTSDVRRQAIQRPSSSPSVSALLRSDPNRPSDESQKRQAGRQQTGESRTGNRDRKPTGSPYVRPVWGTEPPIEIERCPSCGNSEIALRWGDAILDCNGVWCDLPAHIQDLQGSASLISWTIYGGESGPGFRPEGIEGDPKAWARDMHDACAQAGIAYFHKQSAAPRTEMGIELDGEIVRAWP